MKKILLISLLGFFVLLFQHAAAQGWVAEIGIEINHVSYERETLSSAQVSFSGVTQTLGNATSYSGTRATFRIAGTGALTGSLSILARGLAEEPYYPEETPFSKAITISYSGTHTDGCVTNHFIARDDGNELYGYITVYPRVQVSAPARTCESVNLTTTSCGAGFTWEVSESTGGPWGVINGKRSSSISVTPNDLYDAGLSSPYGTKYFRARRGEGTTSEVVTADVYYPGPSATFTKTDPKCHNGSDGSIQVSIVSSMPLITDFVLTVYRGTYPSGTIVEQEDVPGSSYTINNLSGIHSYWIKIANSTDKGKYGACESAFYTNSSPALPALSNPSPVSISFQTSDNRGYAVSCHGGNNGTLTATPSGGTGSYSQYEWAPNVSTSNTASGLTAQKYTVRVKDSNGCWSDEHEKALNQPPPLEVTLNSEGGKGDYDVSCWNKSDGKLSASVSGGVLPYQYAWSTGASSSSIANLVPASYSVTVTDANNCPSTKSKTLSTPDSIHFTIGQLTGLACRGDRTASFEIRSVTNAIKSVYYLWSTEETTQAVSGKPAGRYTATVLDDQGCSAKRTIVIHDPPAHSVTLVPLSNHNGSFVSCDTAEDGKLGTVVKDPSGNTVSAQYYEWYKNGNTLLGGNSLNTVDELGEGNYKVVVTYGSGCKAEATYFLDAPDPIVPVISNNSNYNGALISCNGAQDGSIRALASGGTGTYTYKWNTENTGAVLSGIGAGTYTVTVTDVNGCSGTRSRTVNDPGKIKPAIAVLSNYNGQAISCHDASDAILRASASGGTGSFTYRWNTGVTEADLVNVKAGTYAVTVADVNACTVTKDTTLINPQPVEAQILAVSNYNGFGVKCNQDKNGYVQAGGLGGTNHYTYRWTGSDNTSSLHFNLTAGSYTVTVTDQNGCWSTTSAIVTEPPALQLFLRDSSKVSCFDGADGAITLLAEGGAAGYEYSRDAEVSWQSSPVFSGLTARNHIMIARDVNGCKASISKRLIQPEQLSISFTNIEPAFCADPRGTATAIVSGGVGNYRYNWRDSDGNSFDTDQTITGVMAGIYTVDVRDGNECPISEAVGITSTDGAKVVVQTVVPAKCSYSSDGYAVLEITEGDGPFSYLWPDGQTTIEGINLAKGNYFVKITDAHDCAVIQAVNIPAPSALSVDLVSSVIPTCHGDCDGGIKVAAKGGTGAYRYNWKDTTGDEVSNICSGEHNVTVTDDNGCVLDQAFVLSQPEVLEVKLTEKLLPTCHNGCDGQLIADALGGNGGYMYHWSNSSTKAMADELCPGLYTVTVTDAKNCNAEESFVLENVPANVVNLGGSVTLCVGQTQILDAGPQWSTYSWGSNTGFNSTTQRVTIKEAGLYWVEVLSSKGCMARDTFLLSTSLDLLKARFALATEAMVGDTVVMIDVSWPLPESIAWEYPIEMNKLLDLGDIIFGQFTREGVYSIGLRAFLGECRDRMVKSIKVLSKEEDQSGGRLGYEQFVKEFTLYPNPNDGSFEVRVELLEESPVVISVWSTTPSRMIGKFSATGSQSYLKQVDVRPLSSGTYLLRLDHARGKEYIRFIVY